MSILHVPTKPTTFGGFATCAAVLTPAQPVSVNQLEAAKLLGISDRTLRDWERRGLITGTRPNGGVKLYPYDQVKALAAANGRSA